MAQQVSFVKPIVALTIGVGIQSLCFLALGEPFEDVLLLLALAIFGGALVIGIGVDLDAGASSGVSIQGVGEPKWTDISLDKIRE